MVIVIPVIGTYSMDARELVRAELWPILEGQPRTPARDFWRQLHALSIPDVLNVSGATEFRFDVSTLETSDLKTIACGAAIMARKCGASEAAELFALIEQTVSRRILQEAVREQNQ